MNENGTQETKTCGWCQAVMVDEAAELRQEIEQLEAYADNLKKRLNLTVWELAQEKRARLAAESELAQIKSRLDCNGLADVAALPFGD